MNILFTGTFALIADNSHILIVKLDFTSSFFIIIIYFFFLHCFAVKADIASRIAFVQVGFFDNRGFSVENQSRATANVHC